MILSLFKMFLTINELGKRDILINIFTSQQGVYLTPDTMVKICYCNVFIYTTVDWKVYTLVNEVYFQHRSLVVLQCLSRISKKEINNAYVVNM